MQRAPNTFQNASAPRAYVAGLGRGANAFQTSAATGSIAGPSFGAPPAGYVAGSGRGIGGFGETKPSAVGGLSGPGGSTGGRFDRMLGYEGSLFNNDEYGSEDQYADAVYSSVDEMRKRKDKRAALPAGRSARDVLLPGQNPAKALADNFADLKTKLKQVSADEWGTIPEAHSKVKKKFAKEERFMPVSDSVLASAAASATMGSKVEDYTGLSRARDQMLRVNLDRAGDSIVGQTVVDPRGVLTALSGSDETTAQLGDVKKARLLLKSVTETNPTHGPGWIAAARVDELAGKISAARETMERARDACPDQEDVWLESARIETLDRAKDILAVAVSRHLPTSVSLWMAAADLEISQESVVAAGAARSDVLGKWTRKTSAPLDSITSVDKEELYSRVRARKTILLRALEKIPDSVKLWTQAYALEVVDDKARELLQKAKECCPQAIEFWISLARLDPSVEGAQKCLNQARKRFPGEIRIWIAAARLTEEAVQPPDAALGRIMDLLKEASKRIAAHVDRAAWLKQAEECEEDGYTVTCEAILNIFLGYMVEAPDQMSTWQADAKAFEAQNRVLCSRVCHKMLTQTFVDDEDVWLESVSFERRHGGRPGAIGLVSILQKACDQVGDSQLLWLMYAKEVWVSGDLEGARRILDHAFERLKDSAGEEMWFAATKLAQEVSLMEAREVLRRARESCSDSERVWIKSIVFERKVPADHSLEEPLLREALNRFPRSVKLWLMLGQFTEWRWPNELQRAKTIYQEGIEACASKGSVVYLLWLASARVDERVNSRVTARAILANARGRYPSEPELWLASIRLERRGNEPTSIIDALLTRALQAIPNNGLLLSEQIEVAPEAKKEAIAKDAFERTQGKDAHVILAVARVWWRKRPLDAKKVKKWLERAAALSPKFGDVWGALYRFHKDERDSEDVLHDITERCVKANPNQGERWVSITKSRGNEDLKVQDVLVRVAAVSGPDDSICL